MEHWSCPFQQLGSGTVNFKRYAFVICSRFRNGSPTNFQTLGAPLAPLGGCWTARVAPPSYRSVHGRNEFPGIRSTFFLDLGLRLGRPSILASGSSNRRGGNAKPSIPDLGRMSQLTTLVFCITREAARWIYETTNQGISIVINPIYAVPRLPVI